MKINTFFPPSTINNEKLHEGGATLSIYIFRSTNAEYTRFSNTNQTLKITNGDQSQNPINDTKIEIRQKRTRSGARCLSDLHIPCRPVISTVSPIS